MDAIRCRLCSPPAETSTKFPKAGIASSVTYLNLAFGHVLWQVADHNLALANQAGTLGGRGLSCIASRLYSLLNASSRSCGGGTASGTACGTAATGILSLCRQNLIKRLIKLVGRHFSRWMSDRCEDKSRRGWWQRESDQMEFARRVNRIVVSKFCRDDRDKVSGGRIRPEWEKGCANDL